jgi:cell division protein FtsB
MSYGQYPFWLKNQKNSAESDFSYLKRENEQLKLKIEVLEQELKKLKEK